MKCPKCKTENPEKSKYCSDCGAKLAPTGEVHPSPTRTLITALKDLPIGSTFADRYQVIEELGLGGMGRVYKVMDKSVSEKIALKLLNPEIASDEKTIERFRNELKLARQISHRHVCRMYDLSEAEDSPYITMEYISGEDLKSLIKRAGQVSVGKAVHIAGQICEGLVEAHRLNVIHRDLKPQNIMIDMEGNAKITDFGIARSTKTKGLTDTGVIIGTPEYMSPEQVEGREVDARTDIYSLGVILYELVTGRLPFEGDTPLSVAVKHKIEEPKPPQNFNIQIPQDLNSLILKCMAKDRNLRYQTAGELLDDLKKVKEGVPTTERVFPERKTRASRQITVTFNAKKILVPVLIAAAAALLVLAGLKLFPRKKAVPAGGGMPSLAVMYFENNTGDAALGHWRKALSDLLISDLSQSRYLKVLSGERLYNTLEKMNLLDAETYSSEDLRGVAERSEVENVLVGRYALAGDTFRISIQLQNAYSGEVLGSETVQGEGQESIFAMVDELTTKIKTDFELSSDEIAGDIDAAAETLTSSSPEAYRYYSEGKNFFNKGDYVNTIAMMETAVGFDPEFAMAYRTLSSAYLYLGYGAKAAEIIQRAYDLSDRVSEKERFTIQGQYFSQSEKTFQRAIQAYQNLLDLYPQDEVGNNN
ncbi:MAG: protein kinase, partial [Candidatus Aminicenantes bacterium]